MCSARRALPKTRHTREPSLPAPRYSSMEDEQLCSYTSTKQQPSTLQGMAAASVMYPHKTLVRSRAYFPTTVIGRRHIRREWVNSAMCNLRRHHRNPQNGLDSRGQAWHPTRLSNRPICAALRFGTALKCCRVGQLRPCTLAFPRRGERLAHRPALYCLDRQSRGPSRLIVAEYTVAERVARLRMDWE